MINKEELMQEALKARESSYSPYSKFAVGAALLTKSGIIYHGTNIENASYPLTICAERAAVFSAYSNGVKKNDIEAIAIVADTVDACSPCGACRQVLYELLPSDAKIYLGNLKGVIKEVNTEYLLPFAFDPSDL